MSISKDVEDLIHDLDLINPYLKDNIIYADDYESLKILFKSQYLENFLQHCTDIKIIEKSELEKL